MAEIKYEVVQRIAVLSERPRGWERQLNLISWNDGEPKYDIRDWSPDGTRMGKGISLSHDEMAILKGILDELELSASVGGVCGVHPLTEAIRQADEKMYQNKAERKN